MASSVLPAPGTAVPRNLIATMFGRIAPGYDAANRALSFGVDALWRRRLVRGVERAFLPGSSRRILDLAAGTLEVSLALVRQVPGASVIALDFCLPMLQAGRAKLARAGAFERSRVRFAAGNGLCLPLADCSVDAVTVSFGLRNILPRSAAMAEARRVLAPGGTLHILEFGSAGKRILGGLYNLYLTRVLPYLGGLIAGDAAAYAYLARSVTAFPTAEELGEELREAGFTQVAWQRLWGGIVYLHTGQKGGERAATDAMDAV
ncbi:MAG: ubiquinone/menaquinone biosynthesis methyltransferase [Deltaproteobacteria bacterium]|jgi:demethylmenaquinone methyltransferase/2-methoxy-6-polyprenyl-1,4-benzoquinol methylase|nr:ubiquinone/menaquinone biosynthesis methyltransferase [Deltaproteobacteria bacterium]